MSQRTLPELSATVVGGLAVAGAGLLLRVEGRQEMTTAIVESLFYLALLLFLARQQKLRALLAALPSPRRWLLVGLLGVLLVGQLAGRNPLTFPFVHWSMYSNSFVEHRYLDYTAIREDGVEMRFPIADVYPTGGRSAVWKVMELVQVGMAVRPDPTRATALVQLDALLVAYGRRYNAAHPTEPVRTIHVWECAIPLDDYRGPSSVTRRHLRRVEIPRGALTHAS